MPQKMPIWTVKLEIEDNPEFYFFFQRKYRSQILTGIHKGEGHLGVTQKYTI